MTGFTVTTFVDMDVFHAWEYFFNQINGWWPKEFYTSTNTQRFIIETFIGGKVYEDHGEGGGLIWGDIIGVDYPNSLQVRGNFTKEFGGPAVSYERYTFLTSQQGTEVSYSVDFIGEISKRRIASLKKGWTSLLHTHFIEYCAKR